MEKICLFAAFIFILFTPNAAKAEADGPDFFRLKDGVKALFHPEGSTSRLLLPYGATGLKNLGCSGAPSFNEWENMSPEAKKTATHQGQCKVSYQGRIGWVRHADIQETTMHEKPTFDCGKEHLHEIESIVCKDIELMALDHRMKEIYNQALDAVAKIEASPQSAVNALKAYQYGWVKGRNDCWQALKNQKSCARHSYLQRMSLLQAQWGLVSAKNKVRYTCDRNHSDEVYITFYDAALPSIALEYGDNREIFVLSPMASGAKYEGMFGTFFWIKGNEAQFVWDQSQPPKACLQE